MKNHRKNIDKERYKEWYMIAMVCRQKKIRENMVDYREHV